jgi:hypothetical protein
MKNINEKPVTQSGGANVWLVGLAIFIGIVLILFGASSGSSKQPKSNTRTVSNSATRASVGEDGMLNNNGSRNNCTGIVSVAFTKEAFDDLTNASIAKDKYGYQKVVQDGRAVTVENCTKVKVIESKFAIKKVRLVEKPDVSGWVPAEWVIR